MKTSCTQTKVLRQPRVIAATLLVTFIATVIFSTSCGGGGTEAAPLGEKAPALILSPGSVSFGSQPCDKSSGVRSVTLTNSGTADATIASVSVTGTDAGSFLQANNCGTSMQAGASCTIDITFAPSASGSHAALLTVTDKAGGSPHTVSLSGAATTAAAAVSLSPTGLAFGSQPIPITGAAQTITLTNTGGTTLNITSLTVAGANASDYTQTGTCGSSIAAGANCTIAVMFTPSATGTRTAALSIADNATGSPQTVSLSGSGSHDVILAWPASATSGVIGYNVYRGTTPGGEGSTPMNSTPTSGTTYADQSAAPGATYYYSVTAIASDGISSVDSNQAVATVPSP